MCEINKRGNAEVKIAGRDRCRLWWKSVAFISSLEVANIGGEIRDWEVVHTFIKASMRCDLDAFCRFIAPQDIASGTRDEAKEDAFSGVWFELGLFATRRSNLNTAAESSEVREIFFSGGSKF